MVRSRRRDRDGTAQGRNQLRAVLVADDQQPPNPRLLPPPIDEWTLQRWQLLQADAWGLLLGLSGYVAHPDVSGPQPV